MESTVSSGEKRSTALVAILFFWWIALVLCVFWLFQFQYTSSWVSFEGDKLPELGSDFGALQVVHFVDEACPCSRFSAPHIEKIEQRWMAAGVQFSSVEPTKRGKFDLAYGSSIPASPAVAVWGTAGQLLYFGPYTSGAICGEGVDLLSKVLAKAQGQIEGQWTNSEAIGCFCDWPQSIGLIQES